MIRRIIWKVTKAQSHKEKLSINKFCALVVLIFLLFLFLTSNNVISKRRVVDKAIQKRRELEYIRKRIKKEREKLKRIKKEEEKVSYHLRVAQQKLEKASQDLSYVKSLLNQTEIRKEIVEQHIRKTTQKMNEQRKKFNQRLEQIYKYGDIKYLEILCGASDIFDLLTRFRFIKSIIQADIKLLEDIKETKEVLENRHHELKLKVEKIKDLKEDVARKKETYNNSVAEKKQLINDLQRKRELAEKALRELEQTSREIQTWLKRYEAQRRKRERVARKPIWKIGYFIRPVRGGITSYFGYRIHPIFRRYHFHTGVDFEAPMGTPVRAAASGVVIYSDWWGGYGRCVIIDHGRNIITLYAHLLSSAVSVGKMVSAGQIIAYSDDTGISTGPHLHFEIRINGEPVNPLRFNYARY